LPQHGVRAILLDPEPVGLRSQVEMVVRHYPQWNLTMDATDRSHGVWIQRPKGYLKRLKPRM
jgi:hypothetical protein